MPKHRTPENEDLILALKVAYKFTSHFGSDMSDAVNVVIVETLDKYGETAANDPQAEMLYDAKIRAGESS